MAGNKRMRRTLLSALAAAGLIAAIAPQAMAAGDKPGKAGVTAYVHKYDHPMGSQIRKHEKLTQQEAAAVAPQTTTSTVSGIDVSGWQGNVDWNDWWNQGKRFAYVKATEGTDYTSPYFDQQYTGSYNRGFIRGAYHFARPDLSGGATQADYFVAHGGGWSADGKTLPGLLDIEWGPNDACYGKSASDMVSWIKSFSDEYHAKTGRWPVIYTATSWWSQCTGNIGSFITTNPLFVARYDSSAGTLPYNWTFWTFWQYTSSPIDQDYFSASYDRLQYFATH